jgi:2-methylcitrate dehydratase PrpD
MSAIEQLGAWIATTPTISKELQAKLALHLTDTVGALIASTGTAEGRMLRFREEMRESTGSGLALDLATRCALARSSEIDDIHLASMTTPGAIVIPAVLSLAVAMPSVASRDAVAAMLAGYEAMIRLGRAIDGPAVLYRGIWPTYFTAPFGVAAAASRLLKLDAARSANALALALTLAAPGVGQHHAASTSRWLAVGNAAGNGLQAARAAKVGFTSDLHLMDGSFFERVYGIAFNSAALIAGLGAGSVLREVSFKPWCAARQTMAATEALREIIQSGVPPQEMDRIKVWVLPAHLKMIDHDVKSGDRASCLTSVQYCMAAAALTPDGMPGPDLSPPDPSPAMREFMARITVEADESLLSDYPRRWPARVEACVGSARYERLVTDIPGDPARPFDRARVREKFFRFAVPVIGPEQTEQLFRRCSETLFGDNLRSLVEEIDRVCRAV